MGKSSVVDKDFGWVKINQNLLAYASFTIFVGLPESTSARASAGDLSLAQLGAIHEFGSDAANIPERKWLRAAVDHFRDPILDRYVRLWKKIMKAKSINVRQGVNRIGLFGVARIKEYIRKVGPGVWEPLSQETIRKKKSSRPLLDTGQLINGIDYIVTTKKAASGVQPT